MKIQTRDFGEIDVNAEDEVTFAQPIFGFDSLTRFVFLYDQNNEHIVWLQSVEDSAICFILVAPSVVVGDYHPALPESTVHSLGGGDLMFWLVMVVANDFKQSTVNLKSPIVVNPVQKRAMQVIVDEDLPIRYPLLGDGKECE